MSYNTSLWNSVLSELQRDPNRINEVNSKCIQCQKNQTLRWYEKVVGNPNYSGYALFICLHGGGHGAASMNDSQWKDIIPFESGGFQNGTISKRNNCCCSSWNKQRMEFAFCRRIISSFNKINRELYHIQKC